MHHLKKLWAAPFWGAYLALSKKLSGDTLRAAQGTQTYRRLVRKLQPGFTISEADEALLVKEFGDRVSVTPEVTCYVARCMGTIVGFIQLVRRPPEEIPQAGHWFYGLEVWPLWRRLGIGEALVQRVIDQTQAEHAPELFCLVFDDNRAALNLYHRLGFRRAVHPALEEELEEEVKASGRRRVLLRKPLGLTACG